MSKVRINDLARELEVKSRAILDALTHVGVTEKKTHSSSLEGDEAERVRQYLTRGNARNGSGSAKADSEPKQKIDWSRVSKPGDVLKAIQQRKDEAAAVSVRPPTPAPTQPQAVRPPQAPVVAAAPPSAVQGVSAPPPPRPAPPAPAVQAPRAAAPRPATPPVSSGPVSGGPGAPGQARSHVPGVSSNAPGSSP